MVSSSPYEVGFSRLPLGSVLDQVLLPSHEHSCCHRVARLPNFQIGAQVSTGRGPLSRQKSTRQHMHEAFGLPWVDFVNLRTGPLQTLLLRAPLATWGTSGQKWQNNNYSKMMEMGGRHNNINYGSVYTNFEKFTVKIMCHSYDVFLSKATCLTEQEKANDVSLLR